MVGELMFNALQAIQAGEMGTRARERREYKNALSQAGKAFGGGDYKGAANALLPHDLGAGMQMVQYGQQQEQMAADKAQAAERQKLQSLMSLTDNMLKTIPVERRAEYLMSNWGEIGPIVGESDFTTYWQKSGGDVSDASLEEDLTMLRTQLGMGAPEVEVPKATSPIGKINADLQNEFITPEQAEAAIAKLNAPPRPLVQNTVTTGNPNGYQSVGEVPAGELVPSKLLDGIKIPEGFYPRSTGGQGAGFEFVPISGSDAEGKLNAKNNSAVIDTLIGDYATLNSNKAIVSNENSATENIGAMFSDSPVGRFVDAVGGDVGNAENLEARKNIQGLNMSALMKMISMSDVSARAMDSDAEMKAWLTAIGSDQYESALVKLHVLDQSFGSGQALRTAFEAGTIDQQTYEHVTRRANSDSKAVEMASRMRRYAALEGSIGADNLTPEEASELEALRQWKASQNAG